MATERTLPLIMRHCRVVLRSQSLTPSTHLTRTFTTSPSHQKHGDIPIFTASTNPDLDNLLARIRSTIFLPAHLRTAQRNLIFRTRHHSLLTAEPLMVDIGSENVQLVPLDATKDIPNSWKSIVKAMSLMGANRADWSNLVSLLEGMKIAGRRWKTWQLEMVVRKAGEQGMSSVVVDAVRAAGRTGLVLRDIRVAREAMWACRQRAVKSEWSRSETAKAIRNAESLAEMMEGELHWGGSRRPEGLDPRRSADVLGCVVELCAVRAVRHHEGKDVDGKVEMYAKRLVDHLKGAGEAETMDVKDGEGLKTPWAASADYELLRWVPVRNALRMAKEVLGNSMPRRELVDEKLEKLESVLVDARDVVNGAQGDKREKRRGLKWLEESN